MKKVIIILLIAYFPDTYSDTVSRLNKENNILEFKSALDILNQKSKRECNNLCKVFTPLAPYDKVTCVINAPKNVFVGVPFMVEYAMNVSSMVYIPFWADLLPSHEQMIAQGLRLLHYTIPTLGEFDEHAESMINKDGRGCWRIEQAIPAGTYYMRFTFVAQNPGMKSFTTLLATNPPSYISMMAIEAIDEAPLASNDYAQGYANQPILIPVLDNDFGQSALSIKAVSETKTWQSDNKSGQFSYLYFGCSI